MAWSPKFRIGDIVSNKELYEEFLCGNMGGMRKSNKRNCLVIICDHTKMYDDKWKGGVLHYTGMGKNGDQVLRGNQNGTLYDSDTNGVAVYLFEVMDPAEYTYRGRVKLAGKPYKETQRGEDGHQRQVWMFPIKPVQSFSVAGARGQVPDNPFEGSLWQSSSRNLILLRKVWKECHSSQELHLNRISRHLTMRPIRD